MKFVVETDDVLDEGDDKLEYARWIYKAFDPVAVDVSYVTDEGVVEFVSPVDCGLVKPQH